jgi:hypothetical protein
MVNWRANKMLHTAGDRGSTGAFSGEFKCKEIVRNTAVDIALFTSGAGLTEDEKGQHLG